MNDKTFTLWAMAGNAKGEWAQIANLREWTPTGSRSISDTWTGKVYGKGRKAIKAAEADMRILNANIKRPASIPMEV